MNKRGKRFKKDYDGERSSHRRQVLTLKSDLLNDYTLWEDPVALDLLNTGRIKEREREIDRIERERERERELTN